MVFRIVCLLMGIGFLYFGGWNLIWEGELKFLGSMLTGFEFGKISYEGIVFQHDSFYLKDKSFFFSNEIIVFNFNDFYYGIYNSHKYFNSPILENAFLGFGMAFIFCSFKSR